VVQYPGPQVVSRRLAALPSEGLAWNWDFYGKRTIDEPGGSEARQNIDDSITYRVRRHGGHSFRAASIEGLEHAQAFRSWAVDTLAALIVERVSDAEPPRVRYADLRFSESLESWRAPLDADFVLITFFLDGRDTQGRAFAVAVGGGYRAAQRAISCAVHLQRARIVWCNFDAKVKNNLRQRWSAQQEVDLLLGDMLGQGDIAATDAPPTSTVARLPPADDVPPPPPPPPPAQGQPANVAGPVFHAAPGPENAGPR
jgi:hypothetical protein